MKSIIFALCATFSMQSIANMCNVKIAEMGWASAEFLANLDKILIETAFDCDVELVNGSTVPTLTSMTEKGQPNLAPELWANANRTAIDNAVADGTVKISNKQPFEGVVEGWYISTHMAEQYNLKTVQDVLARPDLFPHPEDKTKGGFVTCPAGWSCERANSALFVAFDMKAKGWRMVEPGSGAGLDGTIAKAYNRKESWFGLYWAPTTILARYPMTLLDWGVEYDAEHWNTCITLGIEECSNPKPTAWTTPEVISLTAGLNNDVNSYVSARSLQNEVYNKYLAIMDENQMSGEDIAIEFILNEKEIWSTWFDKNTVEKISKKF